MAKGGSFKKTTNKWTSSGLEIKKNIEMLSKKPYVKIGVLEGKAEEPKKGEKPVTTGAVPTLVQVATFHEFGTKTIPQRSFLRGTINEFRSLFNQTTIQIHKKVKHLHSILRTMCIAPCLFRIKKMNNERAKKQLND